MAKMVLGCLLFVKKHKVREHVFIASLALVVLFGTGYEAFMSPLQSRFFPQFSLRESVAQNKTHEGLICAAGGSGGVAGGGGGAGGRGFHQIKSETFSCQIKPNEVERFNDEEFIASIKDDVEKAIAASGLKITDRGSPEAGSFYFAYRLENIEGRVSISGKRVRDDYYSLKADLEEKSEDR
jgi:hypothetical protein